MNITRFFNLSVAEAEDYIRSCTAKARELVFSDDIKERLRLTGINNAVHGHYGKIHIRKKSNYIQVRLVYAVLGQERESDTINLSLVFILSKQLHFYLLLDPVTEEIKGIGYRDLVLSAYEIDREKKLKDYLDPFPYL